MELGLGYWRTSAGRPRIASPKVKSASVEMKSARLIVERIFKITRGFLELGGDERGCVKVWREDVEWEERMSNRQVEREVQVDLCVMGEPAQAEAASVPGLIWRLKKYLAANCCAGGTRLLGAGLSSRPLAAFCGSLSLTFPSTTIDCHREEKIGCLDSLKKSLAFDDICPFHCGPPLPRYYLT